MSGNSLNELLAYLRQGSFNFGWGAVLVFSRTVVNRLIEEQYIQGFEGVGFLLPYTERFSINDDQTEEVELRGIVLGTPRLSFEAALLNKAAITVTMNVINGTYTTFRHAAGAVPTVLSSLSLVEGMGFSVSMEIDVGQMTGEVSKQGLVTLDLALGRKVTCNLSGVKKVQELIGNYFQRYFASQSDVRRRFVLGMLKLNNYNPLSPTDFVIRVQRAPGADDARAADGAIVVFIRLKVQDGDPPASIPIEGSGFPYLIPDDQENGQDHYSSALIILRELIPLVDEEQLEVLKNLIFPGQNVFSEITRHEPHDLAVFGSVKLATESVTVEPSRVALSSGQPQSFVARCGNGTAYPNVQWNVRSLDYPTSSGTITSAGLYTPTARPQMRKHRLPILVTARYTEAGQEKVASGVVQEHFESVEIAPLFQIKSGHDQTPIMIHAVTLGTGPLSFTLLEPAHGARLEPVDENHHNYFPPPAAQSDVVLIQKVQAHDLSGGGRADASIILVNKPISLGVEPHYVTGLAPLETVQFKVTNDDILPSMLQWRVMGEGTVDADGVFTAPASQTSMVSVLVCELVLPDPYPVMYGYSIINIETVQPEYVPLRWEALNEFSISAPGGLTKCYANGLQQTPVVITLETQSVDVNGQMIYIPVSDVELSSLRLVDKLTGAQVPFVDNFQEGIEHASPVQWATHSRKNRFSLYASDMPGKMPRDIFPAPRNNGTRYKELYVHMAVEGGRTFYAEFRADNGTVWRSDEDVGGEGEITIQGVRPPVKDVHSDYEFKRDRSFNGQGNSGPNGDDDFNYYLDSVDYWHLSYRKLGAYPVIFATLEVEGNITTIQWESEHLEEKFFSYTGFAFYPARFRGSDVPPAGLSFDIYYRSLLNVLHQPSVSQEFHGGKQPSPGELIVSLHRVATMPYWHDGMANGDRHRLFREVLDPPVTFVLLDEEGNRHRLQIGFEDSSKDDSRNLLIVNLQ